VLGSAVALDDLSVGRSTFMQRESKRSRDAYFSLSLRIYGRAISVHELRQELQSVSRSNSPNIVLAEISKPELNPAEREKMVRSRGFSFPEVFRLRAFDPVWLGGIGNGGFCLLLCLDWWELLYL
jgi:hypothetical protein